MKLFNMTVVALIFFFGLTSLEIESNEEKNNVLEDCVCCNAFEYCDYRNPDDFDDFDTCMTNMGCGIQ